MTEDKDDEKRAEERTPFPLDILVRGAGREARVTASDIAEGGVFVETRDPWDLHAQLELYLYMPHGDPIRTTGRVVRVLRHDRLRHGEVAGMGIELGHMQDGAERWRQFCLASSGRRRYPRASVRLRVEVRATTVEEMTAFWTRNISEGGALFDTDAPLDEGQRLVLSFVHPVTVARYEIEGEVVRRNPSERGYQVAVRFEDAAVQAFRELIEVEAQSDDDEEPEPA